jgi:hypothetical protein
VCKPLIPRELSFYLNAPPEIRSFTPNYKGNSNTCALQQRQQQQQGHCAMAGHDQIRGHISQLS